MKSHFNIRKAKSEDAEYLTECMKLAYGVYIDRLKGIKIPPMDVDYKKEISWFPTWIAEDDKKIVGGIILTLEEDVLSISNISVHPDYQGKGVGKLLMTHAEKIARDKGYTILQLATHILLTENIDIYKHLGWIETGRDSTRVYFQKSIK